ncbi:hypothetical protein ACIQZG_07835 [Lysinibacillus sp. NPDC096418]|uniref:hypothetical protein n=1 Tax=Lysinibacillus sp. NPDC096418 TaxID=3364138 RepID=UPI0037FC6DEF
MRGINNHIQILSEELPSKKDRIVLDEEVVIDKDERRYQFGDGIYEVIKVYVGEEFTLNEHLERSCII